MEVKGDFLIFHIAVRSGVWYYLVFVLVGLSIDRHVLGAVYCDGTLL